MKLGRLLGLCVFLVAGPAGASPAAHQQTGAFHDHLVPDRRDDAGVRASTWARSGGWVSAPPTWIDGGGSRVAALIEVGDAGPAIALEARGVSADAAGPWTTMEETYRGAGHRVAVVDLGRRWHGAEIRMAAGDDVRVGELAWELLEPAYPDAGRISREAAARRPGVIHAVDPVLARIGVMSREAWGARPTTCTATEDDWYRMAIHHTAGAQTSGGTVRGALAAVQAYTMDSGNYCDIPYQFLVGYDGTLWEGRSLALQSGATGGGNNDGNIAVSFLGCYHPNGCPGGVSHTATEEMMSAARLITQSLVRLHDIQSNAGAIKGHRDWPGNATACPGDFVHGRLDELRADLAWYAADEVARSFPANTDAALDVAVGASTEMWIELRNTGGLTWEPGVTFLATTPRDVDSPLYDPSWASATRVATVDAPVAPGEVARFSFEVAAPSAGLHEQSLSLVQEAVTWFGDAPWGGGPGDDAIVVRVNAGSGGGGTDDPNDPPLAPGDDDGNASGGCAVGTTGTGSAGLLLLVVAMVALGRRRR